MTSDAILTQVETLPHGERLRTMAALGRRAATEPAVQRVVYELARRPETRCRLLALASVWGSHDPALPDALRLDPSRLVRAGAHRLLARFGSAEQILRLLGEIPGRTGQQELLATLARFGRREAIDACLATLETTTPALFAHCLASGSADFVGPRLAALAEEIDEVGAIRLARRHAEAWAAALVAAALARERRDPGLLRRANAALPDLSRTAPDAALALVRALLRHFSLVDVQLTPALARRRPIEVADLVRATEGRLWLDLSAIATSLDTERLVDLVRRHPASFGYARDDLWRRLDPERRRALFAAVGTAWRDSDGAFGWAGDIPEAARRHAEARRCFALPALVTRPLERLPYAGLLPWAEAREAVAPFLAGSDASHRGAALQALCRAAGYEAAALPELLTLLIARQFEQDPVRMAFLSALADQIPPGRWKAEHLEALGTVLRHARSAADLSGGTTRAVWRLLGALFRPFPQWAGPEIAAWAMARGAMELSPQQMALSRADAALLEPYLLPAFRAWKEQERDGAVIQSAQALGRRLDAMPGVVDLLEELARHAHGWFANRALEALHDFAPERFRALAPSLLASDRSWVTQSVVWQYLHRSRQDLLTDDLLGARPLVGKFATGRSVFLLPANSGFERWTARQQGVFAAALVARLVDSEQPDPETFRAVTAYAALLDAPVEPLTRLAAADAKNPALRDHALRALARIDSGRGMDELIRALSDGRARVAIYALRPALHELPGDRARAILRAAPRDRLTVAKEVIRLLGDLPRGAGVDDLLPMAGESLHRDLHVALVRALWDHRERDDVWPLFAAAVRSDDPDRATMALQAPVDGLSRAARARCVDLVASGLTHPHWSVRHAALFRALDLVDPEGRLVEPLLALLGMVLPDQRDEAARALVRAVCVEQADVAGEAVRRFRADRPALWAFVTALDQALQSDRSRFAPAAQAVRTELTPDDATISLQATLAIASLDEADLAQELTRQVGARPEMWSLWEARLSARARREGLADLERILNASTEPALRRLALSVLLGRVDGTEGWSDAARAALSSACRDPHPLIASVAQFTFPPESDDQG